MSSGHSYHPKDHGGLKKDGSPDHRVKEENITEREGQAQAAPEDHGSIYKPSEHGGLTKDGHPDRRMREDHITAEAKDQE